MQSGLEILSTPGPVQSGLSILATHGSIKTPMVVFTVLFLLFKH